MKKVLLLLILLSLNNVSFAEFQVLKSFYYLDLKTERLDKNSNDYFIYLIRYTKGNQILKDNTFIILEDGNYKKMIDNNYNYYENQLTFF